MVVCCGEPRRMHELTESNKTIAKKKCSWDFMNQYFKKIRIKQT
jgi:hypothetical protein